MRSLAPASKRTVGNSLAGDCAEAAIDIPHKEGGGLQRAMNTTVCFPLEREENGTSGCLKTWGRNRGIPELGDQAQVAQGSWFLNEATRVHIGVKAVEKMAPESGVGGQFKDS